MSSHSIIGRNRFDLRYESAIQTITLTWILAHQAIKNCGTSILAVLSIFVRINSGIQACFGLGVLGFNAFLEGLDWFGL